MPKSELCKKCAHTKVCFKDKNLFGDVFVAGNPMLFDNKKLYEKFKEREKNGFPCDDFLSIEEPKVGEWVWMGDKGDSRFMCSVCKGKENVPTIMGKPIVWDFCPNCGARMKGEDDV